MNPVYQNQQTFLSFSLRWSLEAAVFEIFLNVWYWYFAFSFFAECTLGLSQFCYTNANRNLTTVWGWRWLVGKKLSEGPRHMFTQSLFFISIAKKKIECLHFFFIISKNFLIHLKEIADIYWIFFFFFCKWNLWECNNVKYTSWIRCKCKFSDLWNFLLSLRFYLH